VRIPLISDHDRFVARLFRVQVNFKGAVPLPSRFANWTDRFGSPRMSRSTGNG
jgi:hypothetical protein